MSAEQTTLLAWQQSLSASERIIVETARKLYACQQAPGTCYNAAFFLCYFLKKHFDIDGRAEVGFINDGVHARYCSHAWYVHKGRITDLGLSRPLNPSIIRPGPLTILGRDITPGWKWNYYSAGSAQGLLALKQLLTTASHNPNDLASLAKQIHIRMSNIARSKTAMRAYLDKCPPGMTYRDLVTAIRQIPTNPAYTRGVDDANHLDQSLMLSWQNSYDDAISA